MRKIYINDGWQLSGGGIDGSVSARVPGCVHTDLYRAGLIPDPFYRDNADKVRWIEDESFTYECKFRAEAHPSASLVFEGLDTYADIYLNGEHVGESHNMFIRHEYSVGAQLRDGENSLRVVFRSPIKEVEGMPQHSGAFTTERMNTRRIQCTYSWDWVGRFVTMGIWLPVYISYPMGVEASDVYIYTSHVDGFGAEIVTELEFVGYEGGGAVAHVEILSPEGEVATETSFYVDRKCYVRRFNVKSPKLWWPSGYGEQPIYTLRVTVGENVLEQSFGIRTLRVVEESDEVGSEYHILAEKMKKTRHGALMSHDEVHSGFLVVVNGEPIFCKGGNWVPCEPFPSEESAEKTTKLVKMARDMGANMLRVWGGGIFEHDVLYDACDREGILVLQDFLMACGEYPEREEWFIGELRLEAEYAVRKLRNHPSLAWWHGDNENATEGSDTQEDYTGRESALSGIARAVTTLDRQRRFLPSSPYGGNTYGSVTVGTTHTTNFLGQIFEYFDSSDCSDYKEYLGGFTARFISEEGVFGGASTPSLLRFMTDGDLVSEGEEMLIYHTKGNPALPKEIFEYVTSYAKKVFGTPRSTSERIFKYAYAQYEWVRLAFENARRSIGYNNGILFWMFNDCWPAALGWALVDYYLMPKASYYAFKRMSAPVTASVTEEDGVYMLHVSVENTVAEGVEYTAYQYDLSDMSSPTAVVQGYVGDVAPRTSTKVELPLSPYDGAVIYVDISHSGGTDRCFYKSGKLPLTECDAIEYTRSGDKLTVKAHAPIHAVVIEGDVLPSDNYFTMLEGEERVITLEKYDAYPTEYPLTVKGYSITA